MKHVEPIYNGGDEYERPEHIVDIFHYFLRCGTCDELALHISVDEGALASSWPNKSSLGEDVPDTVQRQYADALSVKGRLPSAFAVQIRRALEAMCIDRGVGGSTLTTSMTKLVSTLDLPEIAGDVARVARLLGNKGAHFGIDVTTDEATILEDFFLALVEYVYIAPAKLAAYQAALTKLGA